MFAHFGFLAYLSIVYSLPKPSCGPATFNRPDGKNDGGCICFDGYQWSPEVYKCVLVGSTENTPISGGFNSTSDNSTTTDATGSTPSGPESSNATTPISGKETLSTNGENKVSNVQLTVYDAYSNDPSGSMQHYGDGSYENPVCVAVAENSKYFKMGQILYVPFIKKYYKVGDTCEACKNDEGNGILHIDLYVGGKNNGHSVVYQYPERQEGWLCKSQPGNSEVVVDAPSGLEVDTSDFCPQ